MKNNWSIGLSLSKCTLTAILLTAMLFLTGCWKEYGEPTIVGRIDDVYRNTASPYVEPAPAKPTYIRPQKVKPIRGNGLVGRVIVVDAGHGGKDPGAGKVGFSKVAEKIIVLEIAQQVQQDLKRRGARVIMTRNSDKFIELEDRARMATKNRADLLVSIHADSNPSSKINGASVYTARNYSRQSRVAARSIEAAFKRQNVDCRGLRTADFKVLAEHSRPAVLVECGFLTNWRDAKNLNSSWYRKKIGTTIASGIANSFGTK